MGHCNSERLLVIAPTLTPLVAQSSLVASALLTEYRANPLGIDVTLADLAADVRALTPSLGERAALQSRAWGMKHQEGEHDRAAASIDG